MRKIGCFHITGLGDFTLIRIDALIFDLDGTLIDSKQDLARSVRFLQKHYHAPESTDEQVASFVGDGVAKLVERSLPKIPVADLDSAIVIFKKFYRQHCVDHTRLYPGVAETLKHF